MSLGAVDARHRQHPRAVIIEIPTRERGASALFRLRYPHDRRAVPRAGDPAEVGGSPVAHPGGAWSPLR